jgi:acetolactate synthase I/II/III large subunit
MKRVADFIIDEVSKNGANHIFMVTGRGALFLTDAVAAHKEIKAISVHHEQSAAYAAIAYAQYSEQLGACLVSTGCAGTNTITGVLNAWQDGVPCIFISGQNKLEETSRYTGIPVRTYGQQEADLIPIVESITKYAVMITDPKDIVYEVQKAIHLATTGRKGPVWIDIPLDIQNMRIKPDECRSFNGENNNALSPKIDDIKYLIDQLNNASRPAILIGNGIRSANAVSELQYFVDQTKIPVTYSSSAPDIYPLINQNSIGSVGIMGCSRAANFTVQNSDVLLVLGSRLSTMTTGDEVCKFARESKVIVVDIDPVEHKKNDLKKDRFIHADVKQVLSELCQSEIKKTNSEWQAKCNHWKETFPKCESPRDKSEKVDLYYLAECLSETLPKDAVFLSDSGLNELILPANIDFRELRRCIHPSSQGSMGYALPAAIGAYYASKKMVVPVIGDGSVMMNLQELASIKYLNIPMKLIIINNNVYSVIRHRQQELFRSRTIGTDPSDGLGIPNFKKVAEGFEIPYILIENSYNLNDVLTNLFSKEGPVICEIMGIEDQDYISSSYARNSQKRIVRRPIEDQIPYLERELFLSEMIIKPIDQ